LRKRPLIHVTDLFRPYNDPDDHWDLATVYALACRGAHDLKGVLIDYPPKRAGDWNPDITAVAQLNHITGLSVPVSVGSPHPMRSRGDTQPYASRGDHAGVRMVLDILRQSNEPVVISVVGCCRDIAVASKQAPALFAEKCAAVYLNAGTGSPNEDLARKLEYNVSLGRAAYAALFDLPCPLYWMPCFEEMRPRTGRVVRAYGTHYRFRQSDILPDLSPRVRNYFASMFTKKSDHAWLSSLYRPPDQAVLSEHGGHMRSMWCTGGFLHAAGSTVTTDGTIVPLDRAGTTAAFTFDPVAVRCTDEGVTTWSHERSARTRFIFHVRDTARYEAAMTKALRAVLMRLP
jgi:hypothetical protein